ncbi:glycosyltransferase family 2 protein [Candidatus Nitrospira allomarina]|uniref:Glycosyltransferase family 2 protein n=1 Tax=Candidatus Nitrospira allomarina TaxID=3020900 RepID=A0AA96GDF2_9BACT|nr:glycosyltransferase family 2 protein [Candidatus Nitrospira allomarina]WNM57920.1 glycosyltransferase family 2 protein [Candidatus Nitrospira allomarina]
MKILFWVAFVAVLYTYFGYPFLVWVFARIRPRPIKQETIFPSVSMVIAAYNEEKVIGAKMVNTMALAYPEGQLEIIVVADGSTDQTVSIAQSYATQGITVLYRPLRQGKTAALNHAVSSAKGEIIFFSDANTLYEPTVIQKIVRNFHDPSVGGVSGRKVILKDSARQTSQGETAFWNYEGWLKSEESHLGSIVGADGEIFAIRKSLFSSMPPSIVHDDMFLSLKIVETGFRVIYEEEATSAEYSSKTLHDEFFLKVRYASAGYQILSEFRSMFLPPKTIFAFQFISHKLFRWLIPFFLLAMLLASAVIPSLWYQSLFWGQIFFYLAAVLGWVLMEKLGQTNIFYVPLYFCMGNAAALYGFFRHFFSAGQTSLWRKAER